MEINPINDILDKEHSQRFSSRKKNKLILEDKAQFLVADLI
jgi:hypothetical protein